MRLARAGCARRWGPRAPASCARRRSWSRLGPATARRLHDHGITTVGRLAALPETTLMTILGQALGRKLHAMAHNRDPRPVRTRRRRRSFGAQSALGSGRGRSPEALDAV